jgi:hypothetical protein
MPSRDGTPIRPETSPGWIGQLHPHDWQTLGGNDFLGMQQSALMRGHPVPMSWWQRRPQWGPRPIPQGAPWYVTSRPYSRGAEAHAPKFGTLAWNPIGGGVPSAYRLPTIAGPGATYVFGAIWFDVQAIPTSVGLNATVPIETINALIKTSRVAGAYRTTG